MNREPGAPDADADRVRGAATFGRMIRPRVADALVPYLVPHDTLEQHPDNARNGDDDAVADSLYRHGQYAPVVYQQSTRRLLKGHTVWRAAGQLGWTHLAAVALDVDDDRARRIMLDDNRASELGRNDEHALLELLEGLAESDLGLADSLYGLEELDSLRSTLDRVAATSLDPDRPALIDPGELPREPDNSASSSSLPDATPPDPAPPAVSTRETCLHLSPTDHATFTRSVGALRRAGWSGLTATSRLSEVVLAAVTGAVLDAGAAAAEPAP